MFILPLLVYYRIIYLYTHLHTFFVTKKKLILM